MKHRSGIHSVVRHGEAASSNKEAAKSMLANSVNDPQLKEYLKETQLPLRCLLVLDDPITHPQDIDDDLPRGFYFIKVKFLPINAMPLHQPMDQHVICSLKKLY